MFLINQGRLFVALTALGILSVAGRARADAKRCVAENNDAAEQRSAHHLIAARDAYRACVAEPECPTVVRQECDAALSELKSSIPTLLVAVVDEKHNDIAGATLTVDGRDMPVDGTPVEFDPGAHELEAKSGALTTSMQVVAIENDLNRRVELVLKSAPVEASPTPAKQADSAPPPARSHVPSYVLGGVGVLGAASFGYFALSGHSGLSRLDQCKPYCAASDVRDVRTKYLIADVSLGVSVVALAAAGYLLLKGSDQPAESSSSVSVALGATPGAAGLSVRWRQ